MDLMTKNALLLGHYKAMLEYAIDGLKGKTVQQGTQLAEYLEDRISIINEEINKQQYGNFNNVKGNEKSTESNTEAVAGQK
jgi:uncharacterized protein YicC (UPF0701 family)